MFHVEKDAFEDLHATLSLYHEKLEKKGICLRLFQQNKERVTVFVYRRRRLSLLLQREDVRVFLQRYGYPSLGLSEILDHLDRRLDEAEGYPHEIGVFLGYRYPSAARRLFALYDACIRELLNGLRCGQCIEQLI